MSGLPLCPSTMYKPGACQKTESIPVELQTVVSIMYILGIEPQSSGSAASISLMHISSPMNFIKVSTKFLFKPSKYIISIVPLSCQH